MILSQRIRMLRVKFKLSQGDIERTTGLRRQYLSRVENGRTMPSIETLEKLALAMRVPLYHFFHNGNGRVPKPTQAPDRVKLNPEEPTIRRLLKLVPKVREKDRVILLAAAKKMVQLQRMGLRGSGAQP